MKKLALMSALMLAAGNESWGKSGPTAINPDDIDGKLPNAPRPANHRKFVIEGVEIWALNEKNARKKFNKLTGKTNNNEYEIDPRSTLC